MLVSRRPLASNFGRDDDVAVDRIDHSGHCISGLSGGIRLADLLARCHLWAGGFRPNLRSQDGGISAPLRQSVPRQQQAWRHVLHQEKYRALPPSSWRLHYAIWALPVLFPVSSVIHGDGAALYREPATRRLLSQCHRLRPPAVPCSVLVSARAQGGWPRTGTRPRRTGGLQRASER